MHRIAFVVLGVWISTAAFGGPAGVTVSSCKGVDDTATIQHAIDAKGGTVFLPIGTCKITQTLVLKKSSYLVGGGMDMPYYSPPSVGTIIDATSITDGPALKWPGNSANGGLENLYLKGPAALAVSSSEIRGAVGVYAGYFATQFRMRDVYITGFTNSLVLEYADMVTLYDVRTASARTHGFVARDSRNVQCFSCLFQNHGVVAAFNPSNIYIVGAESSNINFYSSLTDEAASGASIVVLSGHDISFENMLVYNTCPGVAIQIGNGTANPDRVHLHNVRTQPFSTGVPTNTIYIAGGSGHVLENVTTVPNGGGDIVDNGTGTVLINVNGKSNLNE